MKQTVYQIYSYDPKLDEAYVNAGRYNSFLTFAEAQERKQVLEGVWSKHGVQYIIVKHIGYEEVRR